MKIFKMIRCKIFRRHNYEAGIAFKPVKIFVDKQSFNGSLGPCGILQCKDCGKVKRMKF
jgi:hypothetical protein